MVAYLQRPDGLEKCEEIIFDKLSSIQCYVKISCACTSKWMGERVCRPDAALVNSVVISRAFGTLLATLEGDDRSSLGFTINGRLCSPPLGDWESSAIGCLVYAKV